VTDVPEATRTAELHGLLLLAAGYAPSASVTAMRSDLAAGRQAEVAAGIVEVVAERRLPLSPVDRSVLAAIVPEDPRLPLLPQFESNQLPGLMYMFRAALPAPGVFEGEVPPVLDLTFAPSAWVEACTDGIDLAAVQAVEMTAGSIALYRSWRYAPPTQPSRVYLLEADVPPAELAALTAQVQQALAEAGQNDPQVEVYRPDSVLPPYQRTARGSSALLWHARSEAPAVQLVRVFDRADAENGPQFDAGHPQLFGDELELAARYLESGSPLLTTTERMPDVVDPQRGQVVPMNYRTDGSWVWTDTVTYYLRVYGLSPDPDLLAHMRSAGYAMPGVDSLGAHRAMASLYLPAEAEPVWTI
jgi:hypothetical protein